MSVKRKYFPPAILIELADFEERLLVGSVGIDSVTTDAMDDWGGIDQIITDPTDDWD